MARGEGEVSVVGMMLRGTLLAGCLVLAAGCTSRVEYSREAAVRPADAVDINTATAAEMERLPGIGSGLAERIIEFRRDNGEFSRAEHILLVRGMSERRFAAIAPYITIAENR
jgi:competence ComEA-like helix-hairpin-helix protein